MTNKEQLLHLSREILEHVNNDILKEGHPIIIETGFEWVRESLSLLAKQSNLFDSSLLLLENGMEQEAYILVRSQYNNMLWISYLCKDVNNERVAEFANEPLLTAYRQFKNIKQFISGLSSSDPHYNYAQAIDLATVDAKISEFEAAITAAGLSLSQHNKGIASLAKDDTTLFAQYISFYNEASKFEHSDISTVSRYRQQVTTEVPANTAFCFDLSKSDIATWKAVYRYALYFLFESISAIYERLKTKEPHLFDPRAFNGDDFASVVLNLKTALDLSYNISE